MAQEGAGQQGDATPEGAGQSLSSNATDETKELKEMIVELQGQVRALQGNKDRGLHQTKAQVDALNKKIDEFTTMQQYLEKYNDPAEAARQQMLDSMIRQGGAPEVPAGGVDDAGLADLQKSQDDVDAELLELLGVDGTSQDYLKAINAGMSPLEAAKAVAKAGKVSQGIQPGEAAGITGGLGGATGLTGNQQQVLQQQYEAELEENKELLQGNPWNVELLKRKYREKGLQIW